MGIFERKQRQRCEVRKGILSAAWKIVEKEGWQAVSIRRIADAIEYSVPVVYDHFECKEAILTEFTRKGFAELGLFVGAQSNGFISAEDQLRAIARAYWLFAMDYRNYYQVMFGLGMPGCEAVKKLPELGVFTELLAAPIASLVQDTDVKDQVVFLKLKSFWAMLHGLVSINITGTTATPDGIDKNDMNEMVLNDLVESFIKGLQQ